MRKHLTPSMIVALIALFVALGGTAVAAAVPLAKRALVADSAKKLQGRTLAQVRAEIAAAGSAAAARPGPASTASALVSVKTAPFSLAADDAETFTVTCDAGAKAISGGFTTPGPAFALNTAPTADGNGWQIFLVNSSSEAVANGTVVAVCVR